MTPITDRGVCAAVVCGVVVVVVWLLLLIPLGIIRGGRSNKLDVADLVTISDACGLGDCRGVTMEMS